MHQSWWVTVLVRNSLFFCHFVYPYVLYPYQSLLYSHPLQCCNQQIVGKSPNAIFEEIASNIFVSPMKCWQSSPRRMKVSDNISISVYFLPVSFISFFSWWFLFDIQNVSHAHTRTHAIFVFSNAQATYLTMLSQNMFDLLLLLLSFAFVEGGRNQMGGRGGRGRLGGRGRGEGRGDGRGRGKISDVFLYWILIEYLYLFLPSLVLFVSLRCVLSIICMCKRNSYFSYSNGIN